MEDSIKRPHFPKRAVITAGMPYGNKSLHFGHIGGVFVPADAYARFLRDRIGKDNVIFVSGTDCYGSPIAEGYRKLCEDGKFSGTIEDFVRGNHESQKQTLKDYEISLNLFAASGLGESRDIHCEVSDRFIRNLYKNGWLKKLVTSQFYDAKLGVFLNGRQVVGRCPVQGCASEKGYADECDLGHQYMPENLIAPKSTLTGETPEMRDVTNWYFSLTDFRELMQKYTDGLKNKGNVRRIVSDTINEFLIPPVIYVKNENLPDYEALKSSLPEHTMRTEEGKTSFVLEFDELTVRDRACEILTENGIRFRTGKTLVPFRLTGNIEWGVPAPSLEGESGLTVWVWPESLWAPISFTKTYLKSKGAPDDEWKKWWLSKDCEVFQFIGQDNIYFYGIAEMAMFMGQQGKENLTTDPEEGQLTLPTLVANYHILFLDKKASSSGKVKPPMAAELLDHYTAEQLRAHFLALGLGLRSVSFQPKPYNPKANPTDSDPALKEGNLLTNVLNRLCRSCFYTTQKHYDGVIPCGEPSADVVDEANGIILEYEEAMYKCELHSVMGILDKYIRDCNKYWAKNMGDADRNDDAALRRQTLIDAFHMLRVCAVLTHPVAPAGTELLVEKLGFGEEFFSWEHIFENVYFFCSDKENHKLTELEPRFDFFAKHPSQFDTK